MKNNKFSVNVYNSETLRKKVYHCYMTSLRNIYFTLLRVFLAIVGEYSNVHVVKLPIVPKVETIGI